MLSLLFAAALVASASNDTRTAYQDGQLWADSGRATAACLTEINAGSQEPLDLAIPANREAVRVVAQTLAGQAQALVRHRDVWLAYVSRLESAPPRTEDVVSLEKAKETAGAAETRTRAFLSRYPGCRFAEDGPAS